MPPRKKAGSRATKGDISLEAPSGSSRTRTSARATNLNSSKRPLATHASKLITDREDADELLMDDRPPPRKQVKLMSSHRSDNEDEDGLFNSSIQQSEYIEEREPWIAEVQRCATTMSEETRTLVEQYKERSANREKGILAVLNQFYPSPRPRESSTRDGRARPELYKTGTLVVDRCNLLLQAYDEANEQLKRNDMEVDQHQWVHDAERMSELLEQGKHFGKELVDSMMQPVLQPQLPEVDVDNAKDTKLMAIEMFDGVEGSLDDTWGRTARTHLDAFEVLLTKEASR